MLPWFRFKRSAGVFLYDHPQPRCLSVCVAEAWEAELANTLATQQLQSHEITAGGRIITQRLTFHPEYAVTPSVLTQLFLCPAATANSFP